MARQRRFLMLLGISWALLASGVPVCGQGTDGASAAWRIELAEELEELSGKPCVMTVRDFAQGSTDHRVGPFLQPARGWETPVVRFAPMSEPADIWGSAPHGEIGRNGRFRLLWAHSQLSSEGSQRWRQELQLEPGHKSEFGSPGLTLKELAVHTPYLQLSFNPQISWEERKQWPSLVLTVFTDTGECFYHRFEKQCEAEPVVRVRHLLNAGQLKTLREWLHITAPWCVTYDRYDLAVWPRETVGWLAFRTPEAIGQMPLPLELSGGLLAVLHELDSKFWDENHGASLPVDSSDWSTRLQYQAWLPAEEPKYLGRPVRSGVEYAFTFEGCQHPHMAWAELCLMRPTAPESKPQFYLSDGRLRPGWRQEVIRPSAAHYVRLHRDEYGIAVNVSNRLAVIADPNERGREYRYLPPPPPTRAQVYCRVDGEARRIFNEPIYRVNPSYVERWEEKDHVPYVLLRYRVELDSPVFADYWTWKGKQKPSATEIRVYDCQRHAFRTFPFQEPIPADQIDMRVAAAIGEVEGAGSGSP